MNVSKFLRQWQLTGDVPDAKDPKIAFWAGWLTGTNNVTPSSNNLEESIEMAAKAAEFIEEHARE